MTPEDRMRAIGARSWPIAAAVTLLLLAGATPAGAGDATGAREVPWVAHLRNVDVALADQDVLGAERAWQEAYLDAIGNWRWEGMLEVADAYLRIGQARHRRQASAARARNLYLAALYRARDQRSVDGLLRIAEAFARLGASNEVESCLRVAEALAAEVPDPRVPERVRSVAARLAHQSAAAAGPTR
jgi:hypothetical protein